MNGDGGTSASLFNAASVAECRESASALRNRAMVAKDPEMRRTLVKIADEWDRLAGEIEAMLPASQ
jgi:hypothetical protein